MVTALSGETGRLQARRFTVEEYHRMAAAGVFAPGERLELLDGVVVSMTPIGSRHASCVARLTRRLVQSLGARALVWPQNPLRLDREWEPQPDVMVLRPRDD